MIRSGVLDVTILSNLVLDELLGIKDLRTDKRIDFVGGIRGLGELKNRVDSGEMQVAFALYPVSMKATDRHSRHGQHHAAEDDVVRTQVTVRFGDPFVEIEGQFIDKTERSKRSVLFLYRIVNKPRKGKKERLDVVIPAEKSL